MNLFPVSARGAFGHLIHLVGFHLLENVVIYSPCIDFTAGHIVIFARSLEQKEVGVMPVAKSTVCWSTSSFFDGTSFFRGFQGKPKGETKNPIWV